MTKNKIKSLLICPHCLSEKLKIGSKSITCQSCQKHYSWKENSAPEMTIFSRLPEDKIHTHQPSKGTDLILDVGAGARQGGSLNIDIRPLPGIVVVCNAVYLPLRDNTFERVLLNQVIEHVRYEEALKLLKELFRVVKPGGVIEVWTPNFQALGVLNVWLFGKIDFSNSQVPSLYSILTGLQEYPENTHQSLWNLKLLIYYAQKAGIIIEEAKTEQKRFDFDNKFFQFLKIFSLIFPHRRGQLYLRGRKPEIGQQKGRMKPKSGTDVWQNCPPKSRA